MGIFGKSEREKLVEELFSSISKSIDLNHFSFEKSRRLLDDFARSHITSCAGIAYTASKIMSTLRDLNSNNKRLSEKVMTLESELTGYRIMEMAQKRAQNSQQDCCDLVRMKKETQSLRKEMQSLREEWGDFTYHFTKCYRNDRF